MSILSMRRRCAGEKKPKYLMTATSNPEIFAICLDKGWCSAEGMTYQDARKVTSIRDTDFQKKNIIHFNELEYFGVTTIAGYAFWQCRNLKTVKLPKNTTVINGKAFAQCDSLLYIDIPASVSSISAGAFIYGTSDNTNMEYIKVYATTPPSIIASTGNKILDGTNSCPIYVPDDSLNEYLTAWSDVASRIKPLSAFSEQYMMTTATNAEVLSVCYANGWCESPDYMTYAEAKLVDNDMFGTVFSGNTQITHFEEFENFTSITYLDNAFNNCRNLKSIKVPDSLISMGSGVFKDCRTLKGISLPNVETVVDVNFGYCYALEYADCPKLKTAGIGLFYPQCGELKYVNLPLLESAGNSAFHYASALKKLVLPKLIITNPNIVTSCNSLICIDFGSMTDIGYKTLIQPNIAQVIIRTPSVALLEDSTYINDTCWIYVPDDLVDSYKSANGWSTHASQIKPISEYTLYDSEVEYIESNGTQYINCGIYPKGTDIIRCRVSIVDNETSGFILSAGYNISGKKYSIDVQNYVNYGSGGKSITPNFEVDTIYDIAFGNNQLVYNGNTIESIGSTTAFECGKVLTLFGESTTSRSKIRLYSFSLEDANGVKKLDMIPVRIGNRGYLYDKVSGELFCNNASSDTFAIGNDIQSENG